MTYPNFWRTLAAIAALLAFAFMWIGIEDTACRWGMECHERAWSTPYAPGDPPTYDP